VQTSCSNGTSNTELTTSYANQNTSLIPLQSGFTNAPAYKYTARLDVYQYLGAEDANTPQEIIDAYLYANGTAAQQQAAEQDYASSIFAGEATLKSQWAAWHGDV
jgi:hypothetical protein